MMYFLIGMLVSFGSVFLTTLIGSLLHKDVLIRRLVSGAIISVIYGLVLWFLFWSGLYGPASFMFPIPSGAVLGALTASFPFDDSINIGWKGIIPGCVLIGGYILYVLIFVLPIGQSSISTHGWFFNGEVPIFLWH